MRTIRTTILALVLAAVPGIVFAACAGHRSADKDGITVATDPSTNPDSQQASTPAEQQGGAGHPPAAHACAYGLGLTALGATPPRRNDRARCGASRHLRAT